MRTIPHQWCHHWRCLCTGVMVRLEAPPARTTTSRYSSPDGSESIDYDALEISFRVCRHVWHRWEWREFGLGLMWLRSSRSLDRVAARNDRWGSEEAWVRAELNAVKAMLEVRECAEWQPHQVRAILIPEAPVAVFLEPLGVREMRCIHVEDPVIHLSIV